jgi:hypothetical protein
LWKREENEKNINGNGKENEGVVFDGNGTDKGNFGKNKCEKFQKI